MTSNLVSHLRTVLERIAKHANHQPPSGLTTDHLVGYWQGRAEGIALEALEARAALENLPVETTEVIRLRAALALMYDKWEDGITCWEDGDNSGISLGNAFKLTDEEEREILSLIPSQRSAVEPKERQHVVDHAGMKPEKATCKCTNRLGFTTKNDGLPHCADCGLPLNPTPAPLADRLAILGFAPGGYSINCMDCKEVRCGCDKRALRCHRCALARDAENGEG